MSWPDPGFLLSPLPTRRAWSSASRSRAAASHCRRPAGAASACGVTGPTCHHEHQIVFG